MRPEVLTAWLQRRPFKPFRFRLVDGTVYEIRHPDQALVVAQALTIFLPFESASEGAEPQEVAIALLHITRLETLPPTVGANGG
jgi:hypothetical protein